MSLNALKSVFEELLSNEIVRIHFGMLLMSELQNNPTEISGLKLIRSDLFSERFAANVVDYDTRNVYITEVAGTVAIHPPLTAPSPAYLP